MPPVGPRTVTPPWNVDLQPSSALVTALLWLAALLGALAVALGLRAVAAGVRPAPRRVAAAGLIAVAVLVAVPPLGSADHLSYVAYGRIAAEGGDPYAVPPSAWHGGTDPVVSGVRPPWQDTPSVYGPVATGVMTATAWLAGSSLRLSVWLWQLVTGAAFLAVGLLLDRATRGDPAARARAAVLWTLNPLLLWQLVLGAHVDVLAAAFAVGALVAGVRRPLLAGVLLGAATGIKAPYALAAVGLLWGLRAVPRPDRGPRGAARAGRRAGRPGAGAPRRRAARLRPAADGERLHLDRVAVAGDRQRGRPRREGPAAGPSSPRSRSCSVSRSGSSCCGAGCSRRPRRPGTARCPQRSRRSPSHCPPGGC